MKKREWFETWFDTPYYQMLYERHGDEEAARFVDSLLQYLRLPESAKVLDAGCGLGRYSLLLADRGYVVTGIDLLPDNIEHASLRERDNLSFHRHDMRELFFVNYFDAAFSFFTGFGYYRTEQEDMKAIRALSHAIKPGGKLVIDFFNAAKASQNLVEHEQVARHGILFSVHKHMEGSTMVKKIYFQDNGREFHFEERVRALTLQDFLKWFSRFRLTLKDVFGDYGLQPFNEEQSDRLILVAEKL